MPEPKGPRHSAEDKERVLRACRERMSTRAIHRAFGVSYPTQMRWAGEKTRALPALEETLPPAEKGDVLELDELWSFTGFKENTLWLRAPLCRRTRQITAWTPGDRSQMKRPPAA